MGSYAASWGEVSRVVVVPNHTNASYKLAEAGCENIQDKLGIPTVIHPTVAGGLKANQPNFGNFLEPGDIVGGYFGDGTAKDVLLALGSVPFISLGGGNARDVGRATHHFRNASPSWLIRHSQLVTAYALECTIKRPNQTDVQNHAMSYIGTGETAYQSGHLDTDKYRLARKGIRDIGVATSALLSKRWFEIIDNDGEQQLLSDLTFAKGPRMAKLARFPIHHWDPAFRVTAIEASPAAKVWTSLGLLAGHAAGITQAEPYTFHTRSGTMMHFDGDPPIEVPAFSDVTVGLHEQTYNLLTTKASNL